MAELRQRRNQLMKRDVKATIRFLQEDGYNHAIEAIYGCAGEETTEYARRFQRAAEQFLALYPEQENQNLGLYTAPGRTELGGNHTDHQCGCVLAGAVNLDTIAAAAPNGSNRIRFFSEGYGLTEIDLSDLSVQTSERETTASLIRGMAAQAASEGAAVFGFDAWCTSSVLSGSGLSSSAAFETLLGVILNDLFAGGKFSPIKIAQMGQHAENLYFGKPSGLMDQMASSVGGLTAIDFEDPHVPKVVKITMDFEQAGYAFCVIDAGDSHADLTDAYASIPREMKSVAALFHQDVLRGITEEQLIQNLPAIRKQCGDRAFLRALHFVRENRRAQDEAAALRNGDMNRFLALVNESGRSSWMYLQNTAVPGRDGQGINVALALCDSLLRGRGACRVQGGGFAGTVEAFVPWEERETFRREVDHALGDGSCHVLRIRPAGGSVL